MSIPQEHQIEKSDEDIRKTVLINIVKMITERKLLKYEDLDKNLNDILSQKSDEQIYKIKQTNPQIVIKLYTAKVASINKTSSIYEFLSKYNEFHKIVVAKEIWLSAGKKVSAPSSRITPTSRKVNSAVFTGKVPGEGGTLFFCARLPARAMTGIIIRKRPISMSQPIATLYHQFGARPAKAEPLLPAPEVKA